MLKTVVKKIADVLGIHSIQNRQLILENAKRSDEILWGLIFNNAISDSEWLLKKSFNPGRWAAGYPMLYLLYRIYNEIKPKAILEFGLGESSKLGYQYDRFFKDVNYIVIEQDDNWLNFFSAQIHDIRPNTILLDIEKSLIKGFEVNQYKGLIKALENKKFNLVIVDGPWGSAHYSRYQVVEIAENYHLHDDFIIIIDDYERPGEKETVAALREVLHQHQVEFAEGVYSGAKKTLLLCSKNYKFLTSL
jgi:hypothetical protein